MLKAVEGLGPSTAALKHLARGLFCHLIRRVDGFVEPELLVDVVEDTLANLVVLFEELFGVLPPLAEAFVAVREPGAALLDHIVLDAGVEQAPLAGDPLSVHHVELHRLERRRYLVLYDLDPGLVAHGVVADLQRPYAPDVQTHAGVELQRPPSRRRLRRAEHDPYLLPQLVDENGRRLGTAERTRKLPERLAHEACLQSHVRVSHLSFDLSPRYEGRDG